MSERALAYSEEPLSHRFLVIYEAAGLRGDFASYLVRSLLSEGRLAYETVEKTSDGLKPRLIERQGPTGLLVTTTLISLHPENETRLFSVPTNDTPEQTRSVLRAIASEKKERVDVAIWHALQRWLEGAEHRCLIPYALQLAECIPPVAVRLRRDFAGVLGLIKAHAILHQASREKDDQGRVIAALEDYGVVRRLVSDLVSEGVEADVPATVRQTVVAVDQLCAMLGDDATVRQVAEELKLDKSAAWRRLQTAIRLGYVKNLETRKGRPAKLVLGDPLPNERVDILPTVERLQACMPVGQDIPVPCPPDTLPEAPAEPDRERIVL
jgi:hypothetical protein